MSRIDNIPLLNSGGILVSFGELTRISSNLLQQITSPDGKIFITHDNSNKSFTGFSLLYKNLHEEIRSHLDQYKIDPEMLCYLAMHQNLKKVEWRFWIVNREIVAATPYSRKGEVVWVQAPNRFSSVAQRMAQNSWQPAIAYVVDIVETECGSVFIREIKSISTSGIYLKIDGALPAQTKVTKERDEQHIFHFRPLLTFFKLLYLNRKRN